MTLFMFTGRLVTTCSKSKIYYVLINKIHITSKEKLFLSGTFTICDKFPFTGHSIFVITLILYMIRSKQVKKLNLCDMAI